VFERLYKDKERYDTRKQIKLIEIEHLESKENTFRPNVNNNNNNNTSFGIGNKAYDVSVSNYLTKTKNNNNNKGTTSRSFINYEKLEEVYKNYQLKKKTKGERSNSVIINNNKDNICTYEKIGEYHFELDNENIPGSDYIERFFLHK
jgi:hypothetical protein